MKIRRLLGDKKQDREKRVFLTEALEKVLGVLPNTGRLVINITGRNVSTLFAEEWHYRSQAEKRDLKLQRETRLQSEVSHDQD